MTHAVSCRPFTAEARIPSHASPYEISGERSDTRGGFNPITSRLHCKQFPTNAPHTYFTNLSSTIYNLSTWQRVYWWHPVVAPYMMNENAVSTVRQNYVYIRSIAYYMFRLLCKSYHEAIRNEGSKNEKFLISNFRRVLNDVCFLLGKKDKLR